MTTRHHQRIEHDLGGYIPVDLVMRGILLRETHGWTAIVIDFDLAGSGRTPAEAFEDATSGVLSYLGLCRDDGLTFNEALRPAPAEIQKMFNDGLQAELDERLGRTHPSKTRTREARETPQLFQTPFSVC